MRLFFVGGIEILSWKNRFEKKAKKNWAFELIRKTGLNDFLL